MRWQPAAVGLAGLAAATLYVASLPAALEELAAVDAPGLAGLGLTARGYALYVVVLVSVLAAVHLAVAFLLLRLAPVRPGAASSALVLIGLGVVFPQTLPALAATDPGWSLAVDVLESATVVALTGWALSFPDGRYRPRWASGVVALVVAAEVAGLLGLLPEDGALGVGLSVGWAAVLAVLVAVRYRGLADGEQRAAVRWVVGGLVGAFGGLAAAAVAQGALGVRPGTVADLMVQAGVVLSFLLVPGTLAAALLRRGLWGVEGSVGRAVTYGALTVAATGGYVAVVALGAAVVPLEPAATATVAAGLLALAVHPAYVWLRRRVDHLLYGDRAEAVAGLAEVGGGSAEAALGSVAALLVRTLRLPWAELTVGGREVVGRAAAGVLQPAWPVDEVGLRHLGRPVGTLVLARRDRSGAPADADRRAVADVVPQLSVLAHSLLLTEELRQSRRRLVTAREEERRRLRNDLHDGLGPALSAVLFTLAAAENRLADDPGEAGRLVGEARGQTAAAVRDVRRLVHGMRPPALDELGLVGALRALLARLSAGGPTFHLAVGDVDGLPAAVEVAVYRIVSEAATNVVRHARANEATVTLARAGGVLEVTVADGGTGCPDAVPGVGLTSMRERAAELGGSVTVTATEPHGTLVRGLLPLDTVATEPAHG